MQEYLIEHNSTVSGNRLGDWKGDGFNLRMNCNCQLLMICTGEG